MKTCDIAYPSLFVKLSGILRPSITGRLDKPKDLGTILSLAVAPDGNTIVYTAKRFTIESK